MTAFEHHARFVATRSSADLWILSYRGVSRDEGGGR